jgi:hypothetical protein
MKTWSIDNNNDVENNQQRSDVISDDGKNASGDHSDSKNSRSIRKGNDDDSIQQHSCCSFLWCCCSSYFIMKWYSIPFAFRETFGSAITKLFFGGFFWQRFAFATATLSSETWTYALVAGCGDAIGVFAGNMFRLWMESTSAKYKQSTFIVTAFADHQTQSKQICCGGGLLSKGLRVLFTPEKYPGHNNA